MVTWLGPQGPSIAAFYLSLDLIVGPIDIPHGSRAVANLAPGASASGTPSVTLPLSVTPGTYFIIIVVAEVNGVVAESGEGNYGSDQPENYPILAFGRAPCPLGGGVR